MPEVTGSRVTGVQQSAGIRLALDALRALLLLALSVGYLVPALHFSLVQHEICPEHGELRHSYGATLNTERSASQQGAVLNAAARIEHEHEHCAVLATSSSRATSAPRPEIALAAPAATVVGEISPTNVAHPSLELLFYAPKLPPPS